MTFDLTGKQNSIFHENEKYLKCTQDGKCIFMFTFSCAFIVLLVVGSTLKVSIVCKIHCKIDMGISLDGSSRTTLKRKSTADRVNSRSAKVLQSSKILLSIFIVGWCTWAVVKYLQLWRNSS